VTGATHHPGPTVRRATARADRYVRVLGLRVVATVTAPGGTRHELFPRHDGLPARLLLTGHRAGTAATGLPP
jgi:catechol 2,3-dioxygenase-like lactoylglutathione lyase family enzyme